MLAHERIADRQGRGVEHDPGREVAAGSAGSERHGPADPGRSAGDRLEWRIELELDVVDALGVLEVERQRSGDGESGGGGQHGKETNGGAEVGFHVQSR